MKKVILGANAPTVLYLYHNYGSSQEIIRNDRNWIGGPGVNIANPATYDAFIVSDRTFVSTQFNELLLVPNGNLSDDQFDQYLSNNISSGVGGQTGLTVAVSTPPTNTDTWTKIKFTRPRTKLNINVLNGSFGVYFTFEDPAMIPINRTLVPYDPVVGASPQVSIDGNQVAAGPIIQVYPKIGYIPKSSQQDFDYSFANKIFTAMWVIGEKGWVEAATPGVIITAY